MVMTAALETRGLPRSLRPLTCARGSNTVPWRGRAVVDPRPILTEKPHLAGTQEGYNLAEYVRQTWEDQGLDSAHMAPYDVLLSYPDPDNPSYVALVDEDNEEVFRSSPGEPQVDVDPAANISSVVPPFAAYSPARVVEHEVHDRFATTPASTRGTGRESSGKQTVIESTGADAEPNKKGAGVTDFDLLKSRGISVRGKMVIALYGRTSRGRKLRRAQDRGAVGMIVYSDPREVVGIGLGSTRQYPAGWYAPGTAVQRGHFLYTTGEGEPLTPGYPAKDYTYIMEESESDQLPRIPVHVIGYTDAIELLRRRGSPEDPHKSRPTRVLARLGHFVIKGTVSSTRVSVFCTGSCMVMSGTSDVGRTSGGMVVCVPTSDDSRLKSHLMTTCCPDLEYHCWRVVTNSLRTLLLISKLEYYGIQGPTLNWLKAFLTNREQTVVVEGKASAPVKVASGVPQGTVLGRKFDFAARKSTHRPLRVKRASIS
ncbi:hypothetical protein Bbelb_028550, partial [Branchiostoma belcheri]